jgi:hypothetical protein
MVGRTKTVIVHEKGDNPVGIISEIVARVSSKGGEDRLVFRGPVSFDDRGLRHLHSIIIPLVDRIMESLDVPGKNYEISVVNLGATASAGKGIEISGFSADLPVLLALLSSSLQVGLRQDIVSTGHVASLDGDIAPVRGISTKIAALLASSDITSFVLPDLEKDRSLEVLTPVEYETVKESLLRHKGEIRIHSISGIQDAVSAFMTDESIVLGSLRTGFFDAKGTFMRSKGPVDRTVALLAEGNEDRFWDVLEHSLLNRRIEKARLLLQTYVDYHMGKQRYPENFGEQLSRLVISLPPPIRKLNDLFPLLPMGLCINLSQHAKKHDMDDVWQLQKAAFGEGLSRLPYPADKTEKVPFLKGRRENEMFEWLLSELNEENLTEKFGVPLDEARLRYATDAVTVRDAFEFNEVITAFYAHLFRHIASPLGHAKRNVLSGDAIELVEKAFKHKGGYKGAVSEGKFATHGGMRLVFDAMTEQEKQDRKAKYITAVFKKTIDSFDGDSQVRLMKAFMDLIGPGLPADLRDLPAEKLAPHWETIIRHYIELKEKVSDLLKRL